MSLPITEVVDVTVSLTGASPTKFNFGSLLGIFDHSVTANRQDGPYTSVASAEAAGFTAAAEPEVNAWVTAAFASDLGVNQVIIGREDAGDSTWTDTMTAVSAADPNSWYITNVETRTEADILLVATFIEATKPRKIYIAQSLDAAILAGTPGNVALDLQTAARNRTALIYHDTASGADGYLDASWSSRCGGFNLDAPNGVGDWYHKALSGTTVDDQLSETEIGEILDANANLYASLKGLPMTFKGTMASGRFIDVTTSLDWIKVRTEEAIVAKFAGTPTRVPYTNAGMNMLEAAVESVFGNGVDYGHLSPDVKGIVSTPLVKDVSSATKLTRVVTMTGSHMLASGVVKVVLNISVEP